MTSTDPPGIMFVGFCHEKYLLANTKYVMVIPARSRIVCMGKHVPDEKLKINKLGPKMLNISKATS